MLRDLGTVTLTRGERVAAAVVAGPDPEWAPRIERMLAHKGEHWRWQNAEMLRERLDLDAHFYILHRDGAPFANIMTIEHHGMGLFGHVWTDESDRGQGASSSLLTLVMADVRARGGRGLWLGTGRDTHPWRMYHKAGFRELHPRSHEMAWFARDANATLADWFAPSPAAIEPLGWAHWPASAPLYAGAFPGAVRAPGIGLVGQRIPEGPLLAPIRAERARSAAGETPHAVALRTQGGAVLAIALRSPGPLPGLPQLDLYAHPSAWARAGELVDALKLESGAPLAAWSDAACPQQGDALQRLGFTRAGALAGACTDGGGGDALLWRRGRT